MAPASRALLTFRPVSTPGGRLCCEHRAAGRGGVKARKRSHLVRETAFSLRVLCDDFRMRRAYLSRRADHRVARGQPRADSAALNITIMTNGARHSLQGLSRPSCGPGRSVSSYPWSCDMFLRRYCHTIGSEGWAARSRDDVPGPGFTPVRSWDLHIRLRLLAGLLGKFFDQLGCRLQKNSAVAGPRLLRNFTQFPRHVDEPSFESAFYLDHHPGLHQSRNNDNITILLFK